MIKTDSNSTTHHAPRTTDNKICYTLDLGLIEYREALKLQEKLVAARVNKSVSNDFILFQEHPAVFTLGRRGGLDHLLVSEAFLQEAGIPVVQIERGGFITYHGPGQLVVYPIINLHARRLGVKDFVAAMEEAMLQTARYWDIAATRNPLNRGIWVGTQKMGSIGIALRKGVSFHGLALNVNLDLTPFSWIQPCGLQGVATTSMRKERGEELPLNEVLAVLKHQLAAVLGFSFETCKLSDLEGRLSEKN